MKKLTLEIDALHVETFQVDPAMAWQRGTVQGAGSYTYDLSCETHCMPVPMTHGACRI